MLEILEVTEYEDDDSWSLMLDEDTLVIAGSESDEDRLFLSTDVAVPEEV